MNASRGKPENVVIRASAGTGKTFQLTSRYLSLAAADEPLDAILATTFTRKAAGEILARVLLRLAEAAADPKKLGSLADALGEPSLDASRCRTLLCRMVRRLHRLRVSTLDSFFLQIARSFSLELGLPPGWQVVDELADSRLRAEAIRDVLDDHATDDVLRLVHLLTKGEAKRSVSEQIAQLVDDLYSIYLEAPAEAWNALPRYKPLETEALIDVIESVAAANLEGDRRMVKARGEDLDRARAEAWDEFLGKGLANKVLEDECEYYKKPIPPDVVDAYRPLLDHAKAVLLGQIANQTSATRAMLDRFDAAYQRRKFAMRALRFEDVTGRLGRAGLEHRIDQIVHRLDTHVAHLLLDEFQDTSPAQWRVLRPFARHTVEAAGRRSFFCVGDVKQAIYGWRGGEAEIFDAIEEDLHRLVPQTLNTSWRSSPAIIETVNRVFSTLRENVVAQKYPDACKAWSSRFQTHTTVRDDLAGYARLVVAPRAAEGADQEVATWRFAADEIARLHHEAPGRTVGVLVRRNRAVARLIYELRNCQVEASEEGGNPLVDSPAVELILALLTLADHPGSTVSRFHVAHSPLGPAVGLVDHEDTDAAVRLARDVHRRLAGGGYGRTIYGWVRILAPECDARDLGRLVQLVEMAYRYQARATARTDDFVAMVSQERVENPRPADVRVMTVHQAKGLEFDIVVLPELEVALTGQTPQIVTGRPGPGKDIERVCRYVNKDLRRLLPGSFERLFTERDRRVIEESLCVLYVAVTRAVHSLHMIVAPSAENEKSLRATAAGLLRAALAGPGKLEPGAVPFEYGDPHWFDKSKGPKKRSPGEAETSGGEDTSLAPPLRVHLAPPSSRAARGLDRRSPSELEGGSRVNLSTFLRLDADAALDRGTLIHVWFEQIEWLDDGLPAEKLLLEKAAGLGLSRLDVPRELALLQKTLSTGAVREALVRAELTRPAPGLPEEWIHAGPHAAAPRWEVWRERPFAIRDGEAILSGKFDRLVVLYDGNRPVAADILDFKTDAVANRGPALTARVAFYRPQLEAYRRAAARLLGLSSSRILTRLAFVEPNVVEIVKP